MNQFTWGVIGPGKIANKFATAITLVEGCTLGAIASRDKAKAQAFAEQHGSPRIYDNYEALAADPNIDAIYIATPHGFHAEHAILCLRQGKAVLCEKPMALSARQVSEMISTAKAHKTFLMEAMWTRFLPIIAEIDKLIANGEIGELKYARADFGFLAPFDREGRLYNMRLGGGSLLDIGIYPLFLALHLFGAPEQIIASGHLAPTGADDSCHVILKFPHIPSAADPNAAPTPPFSVISSTLLCQTSLTAEIAGTTGSIHIPTPWYKNDHFTLNKVAQDSRPTQPPATAQPIQLEPMTNGFEYQIREVMTCVAAGLTESPKMSHDFSMLMARTMDTIRAQLGVKYPTE